MWSVGRDSSVGIATRYGLGGPGEIFRTRPDRPWGPPSLLYNGYGVFPGSKAAGAWRWPPTSGPSWPILGRTLPLPLDVKLKSFMSVIFVSGYCERFIWSRSKFFNLVCMTMLVGLWFLTEYILVHGCINILLQIIFLNKDPSVTWHLQGKQV